MGANSKPAGIVVLGMHRSGTSAVAGYLAKAGFFAGDDTDLLPAAEDNPRGFFERTDVNELNDGVLADLGGNWDRPPPRDVVTAKAPAYTGRVEALLGSLASQAQGRPIVLKDPRISLLLPAWLPALEDRFHLVIIDRPPVEVAKSVRKRDDRPLYVALALWQIYCTQLAHGLAGREVLVVRYQDFVADPERRGPWLLDQVGQKLPSSAMAATSVAGAAGFVSPQMRHHRSPDAARDERQLLTLAQAELAQWLGGLPEQWQVLPEPGRVGEEPEAALTAAAEYYDAMGDRHGMETAYDLERHKALHFEQATELKDHHIANLENELERLRPLCEAQAGRLAELEEANAALSQANQELRAQLDKLHHDSLAAAGNLLSAARRSLSKPGG